MRSITSFGLILSKYISSLLGEMCALCYVANNLLDLFAYK